MIYVHSNQEYLMSENINQSTLKDLVDGLDSFLAKQAKKEVEKAHFVKGSLIDVMLTGTKEDVTREFYVSVLEEKPSDKEMEMSKDLVRIYFEQSLEKITDDVILHVTNNIHDWQKRWKDETKLNHIKEKCLPYVRELIASNGKQVVSQSEYSLAETISNGLRQWDKTAEFFDGTYAESETVDIHFQLPIYFVIDGVKCKALLDMLVVYKNEKGEVIRIRPFDIKSIGDYTLKFHLNLKRFRYDIQGAWYTDALFAQESTFTDMYDLFHEDVVIEPFTFIVDSTLKPGNPLMFVMTENLLNIGRFGREAITGMNLENIFFHNEDKNQSSVASHLLSPGIVGYHSLLKRYQYYVESGWQTEKIVADCDGVLGVDWNGPTYLGVH